MCTLGCAHLVNGHRQRVNVALLRWVAVLDVELLWIQQFRSHVADDSWLWNRRVTWLHDRRIGDDPHYAEVPEARNAILGDQHIPLHRTWISVRSGPRAPILAHRIDVAVDDTQRMQISEAAGSLGELSRVVSQTVHPQRYGNCLPAAIDRPSDPSGCIQGCFRWASKG